MRIIGLIGAVIAIVLALGSVGYYVNLSANTYRIMHGDSSALNNIINDTNEEIIGEAHYTIGITFILEVLGALLAIGLPVGGLIAFIKKNCD